LTHSRSAEKRVRQAEERRLRNRSTRSATRTRIRKVLPLVATNRLDEAESAVREAVSALDKAAEKGVIHANNAARRKSRLMLKYNAAVSAAAAAAEAEAAKPARRTAAKKATPAKAPAKPAPKKPAPKKPAPKKPAPKKPTPKKTTAKSKT
jgi:small subunit ribosomal protein S20